MSSRVQTGRDPLLGAILGGKYRVEALLARGGMGRVYRGTQEPLGRPVAIKVLDFHALDQERNEQIEKRFFLEASVCARLTHPNTLTIHDYGAIDGGHGVFIAMELLDGKSLREIQKEVRALPWPRVVHIARQICGALHEAHDAGLVHRDLKPGNVVLVDRSGDPDFVKVVDFGLVKQVAARDESAEILTAEGLFLGTPRYMAPEQISGEDVDARTDVYALGVMLYEALAGRPPFRSKVRGEVPVDLFNAHLRKPPPPLSEQELAVSVPKPLEAIVMRCLEKEPARRFQSMREVLAALDVLRGSDEAATHVEAVPRMTIARALADTLPDEAPSDQITVATKELPPPAPGLGTSARLVAALSGALLLFAAVGVGWLLLRARPGDEPTVEVTALATVPTTQAAPATPEPPAATAGFALRVTSTPAGAEVRRGDERLGVTPLEVQLSAAALEAGAKTLALSLDGHHAVERALVAPREGPLVIDVTLEPVKEIVKEPVRTRTPERKRPKRGKRPPAGDADLDIKVDR